MLDTITISTAITPIEANFLIHNSKSVKFEITSTGATSKDLKRYGILVLNVWISKEKLIKEPFHERTCLLNVTIDATKLKYNSSKTTHESSNSFTIEQILKRISDDFPFTSSKAYNFNRKADLEWKIKDAYFIYNFVGKQKQTYYDFLHGGYELSKSKLERIAHRPKQDGKSTLYVTEYAGKHKEDSERYQESVHIKIELNKYNDETDTATSFENFLTSDTDILFEDMQDSPDTSPQIEECETLLYYPKKIKKNRLQVQIQAKRNKIIKLCAKRGNPNRDIKMFLEQADDIDAELFKHYITQITGEGKFYKYKDAEKIIRKSEHTRKEQDKMCDVLRGIASYKGITNYLNHVEDATLTYDCMASVRKKPYALKVMRNLQKLQICPFTLPVRSKIKSPLDDLYTIYERGYTPRKR